MLNGPVLALADQRRPGKHDRQHGDVVDNRHHRAKAGRFQIRVKAHTHFQRHRRLIVVTVTRHKAVHLAADDILDIAVAGKGLAHPRGIDVNLYIRLPTGQHITLKIRWNVHGEGVAPGVQSGIHLISGDHLRR